MLEVKSVVSFALSATLVVNPFSAVNAKAHAEIAPIELKVIRGELSQESTNA